MEPPLPAGAEVPAGQVLSLGPRATVNLVHYGKCEFVMLRGGSLLLKETGYELSGGAVLRTEVASCPASRRPQLARSGEVSGLGGVRLRNMAPPQTMQTRPRIVVAGPAAPEIVAAEIAQGERVLVRLPVNGGKAAWPADVPPLQPGTGYAVRFLRRSGEVTAMSANVSRDLESDGHLPTVFALER